MMQMTKIKRSLSLFLCTVLIAATALAVTGCSGKDDAASGSGSSAAAGSSTAQVNSSAAQPGSSTAQTGGKVLGEGKTVFTFVVTDGDGNETAFEIHTDKATVGEALTELGLIAGEEGQYGLYVTEVNGVAADYDKDGVYWAFYVDGEYASAGVDATEVTAGAAYAFKLEKA